MIIDAAGERSEQGRFLANSPVSSNAGLDSAGRTRGLFRQSQTRLVPYPCDAVQFIEDIATVIEGYGRDGRGAICEGQLLLLQRMMKVPGAPKLLEHWPRNDSDLRSRGVLL